MFAGLTVSAETDPVDITAQKLTNADFAADEGLVSGGVNTYDYDMADDGIGAGGEARFGMQPVTGWTASSPSDNIKVMQSGSSPVREDGANAKATGIFAYVEGNTAWLGGTSYVVPQVEATGSNGKALGLLAVWSASVQYTQDVELEAGAYRLVITYMNTSGTGSISSDLMGFIAEDGTKYVGTATSYEVGDVEWATEEVEFYLKEGAKGVISLGYASSNGGSGSMPHLFIDNVKLYSIDATPIIQAEIDAAKEDLVVLIDAGKELGVNTSAAQAVYDDPNATLEEVLAAIESQRELNEKGLTDFTDFFINNAHFTKGAPMDNGITTYSKDMASNNTTYYGMQPVEDWTANAPEQDARASGVFAVGSADNIWLGGPGFTTPATKANGATEGNIFGFVSVWSAESYYYQQVTLPAGTYTITIPTYNGGGTGEVAKNLCGFIADSGEEYLAETKKFAVGKWTEETIKFTLDEETAGRISIGYTAANAGSGSMPHLWIDEFLLKYNGVLDIKPSLLALQGTVRTAEDYLTFSEGQYEEAILLQLKSAYDTAAALVDAKSEDDDANIAAATALNNLVAQARDSRALYEKFEQFINGRLSATIDKYAAPDQLPALAEQLETLQEEYTEAYENGSYSAEQINAAIDGLNAIVVAAVTDAFQKAAAAGGEQNLDITALFTNTDWADDTTTGWSNETNTSAFKSRAHTAEVWGQSSFNIYQTLADMPAGAYEITAQAFFRVASNQENYNNADGMLYDGMSYVYANSNRTPLRNVLEFAVAETDESHTGAIETAEGSTIYVPNAMEEANIIFTTGEGAPNTVLTALTETGDLTFGIKGVGLEKDTWTIFGEFKVVYRGEAGIGEALNAQIEQLMVEAQALYDENCSGVLQAKANIEDAITAGEAALEQETAAKQNAIAALQGAIEYASKCSDLVQSLVNLHASYEELIGNASFDSNYAGFNDMFDEVGAAIAMEEYDSNEQIEAWMESFKIEWSKYVLGQDGMEEASIDNPLEISPIIINNDFETGDLSGWNIEAKNGDTGAKATDNSTYAMENSNGAYLYNTWNGGAVGYALNQDIALPAGFYTLRCVVATDDQKVVVVHVGEQTDSVTCVGKTVGIEVAIDFAVEKAQQTLNIGVSSVDTWYKADNFRLFYIGKVAPDAIATLNDDKNATRDARIFNVAGQQVAAPKKGIYIIGNRKVVVK